MEAAEGDAVGGAFGARQATLKMTRSWLDISGDQVMHIRPRDALFGHVESRSTLVQQPVELRCHGHVHRGREKMTMTRAVSRIDEQPFTPPTILLVGRSGSAGKTPAS